MSEHIDPVNEPEQDTIDTGTNEPELSETEQLRIELDQAKDRALRALADLENYRARVNRQSAEERKYANMDLMREMLGVWDNIGRTLDAVNQTRNLDALIEGVKMVHDQVLDVLARFHCHRMETMHQPFDPNFEASVAQLPNNDHPVGTVIEETQAGFKLHDRVVRPAQVVLSAGPAAENTAE